MAERLTRQQLYDRIKETGKDSYVLSEMKRLGFWKSSEGNPSVPEQLIQREGELHKELSNLNSKMRTYQSREAMLLEMRKKRMEAAKLKREETKKRREEKRKQRAEAWEAKKEQEIVYLGEGVSGGLNHHEANAETLAKWNLPHFRSTLELSNEMGITLNELRFLAYHRKIAKVSHYQRFLLKKKSGGFRRISAPMPRLKTAQYWVLDNVLSKVVPYHTAHGFVEKRSILTNATPHIGKDVVVNLDLKDFFPTITYKRVKGLFKSLGYSEQIATVLGLLCTEAEADVIELDGATYYAAQGERFLPQGAPTSPAITNLICYTLDKRFEGLAKKMNYSYTRYADDLTFSAKGEEAKQVGSILHHVRKVVVEEGFILHPDKIKVMRKGSQQEVTGIVVNEKLGVDRETLRKFRALLHQIEKTGIIGKSWGAGNIISSITGFANFVAMVKPEQGAKLKAQVAAIVANPETKKQMKQLAKEAAEAAVIQPENPEKTLLIPPKEEKVKKPAQDADEKNWWEVF
ncbi:MAG: reverse transcriptase domain-containing protein [Bacteroidia bacterium]